MEEVIALVIQFFLEFGLQLLGSLGFDLATSRGDRDEPGCGWFVAFAVFGGICGGVSLVFAPNPLLPNAGLRIANLFFAPLVAGGLSALFARSMGGKGWDPTHHFWRGFWFAMFFGLARFAYISR